MRQATLAALHAWGIEPAALAPLAGGAVNEHWRVEAAAGPLVLRRYHRTHAREATPYEHALLRYLDGNGWPVAAPLSTPAGETTVEAGGGRWALFPFLPGAPLADSPRALQRMGALLALLQAETTGEGQRVETSMQEALSICQETAHLQWDFQHTSRERMGEQHRMPGIGTYQTQDGYIYSAVGIPGFGAPWSELIRWMDDEGRAEELTEPEYAETFASFNMRDLALGSTLDDLGPVMSRAQEVLTAFYASKASLEVYEQGQARRLLIGMVASPADIGDDEHLNTREWWLEFDQPTRLGSDDAQVRMPGPPYRLSDTPTSIRRPAPQIGEHNQEVWVDEVGIPAEDLIAFAGEGAI